MNGEQPKLHKLVFLVDNRDTFNLIKSGSKKIETRAGNLDYLKIKAGDSIEFSCGDESFVRLVRNKHSFSSLDELFTAYLPAQINPGFSDYEELRKLYLTFPGYKERIQEYGVLAFELE